ncbi:type II toxin-antitoxin system PemK/MazF family toxin [Patescibacteria group bacterium]|nr:type II toxin-antitoxin system PemK/MazF family toxin [Patescibacteria group bacterium]
MFICPLTSKTKTGDFYYKINDKNTAILSEAKYIDKKRLIKKINHIENTIIKEMKKAISRWKKLSRDYSFDSFFLNGGILLLRGSYY